MDIFTSFIPRRNLEVVQILDLHLFFFLSLEHQKLHHVPDRTDEEPFPFAVKYKSDVGRCVILH